MSRKNKPRKDKVPLQPVLQPRFPLKEALLAATALCVAGFLAYSNSFAGCFLFDDDYFVKDIQAHSLWKYLLAPNSLSRPVVSLTLAFNYALGGLAVGGYHAVNLAVHLLAALTLFGIVRRTLRLDGLRERFGAAAGWLALAVALLWLVHPLQTESVTYIVQRGESLAGLFYMLTLYCVVRGAEVQALELVPLAEPRLFAAQPVVRDKALAAKSRSQWHHRRWFALALLACALGMACKPTMVTAPLVVFAYDRIFLAKDAATAWRKRWGLYIGLAATWLILAALIFNSPPAASAGFSMTVRTPADYAQTQFGVILLYLRLSFCPGTLCLDYLWPVAHGLGEILPGIFVVGTLVGVTLWAWVRHSAWSFLGLWFFIILAPTSSFMPIMDLAVEHRLYLSLAAVVTLAVVGVYMLGAAFLHYLSLSEAWRQILCKLAASCAIVTATALLGYLTYQRNTDYHDPVVMWRDVLKKRPKNCRAYNNAGLELYCQAKNEEALEYFNTALELNPQYAEAYYNRGNVRREKGDYDGAITDYNKALELNPRYADAYDNRGIVLLGKGDYDRANMDFTKAVELDRSNWQAWLNKGLLLGRIGREVEAKACFVEGLKINPNFRGSLADMIAQARAEHHALLEKTQAGK